MNDVQAGLLTFIQFFRSLDISVDCVEQLENGVAIGQFIIKVEGVQLAEESFIKDPNIYGAGFSNLKSIIDELERYNKEVLAMDGYQVQLNAYDICVQKNKPELLKLLKECFTVASKASNNSYFIQKIITLDEKSQYYFAQILQETLQADQHQSPVKQNPEYFRKSCSNQQLDLIDKLYEYQQENEKISLELKRLAADHYSTLQECHTHRIQLDSFKIQNEDLKIALVQLEDTITQIKRKKEDEKDKNFNDKENCHSNGLKQMENQIHQYKDTIEMLRVQNQGLRKNFQYKLKDLEQIILIQKDSKKRLKQQIQRLKNQLQLMGQRCEDYERQFIKLTENLDRMKQQNKVLQEQQTTLKFQLNYKNSQIEQLKEVVLNASINTNREEDLRFSHQKSKILLSEVQASLTPMSPKSLMKLDMTELRNLRVQVKELQRQIQALQDIKVHNKELEYEKKKLMGILKEYESSRGEENDIITGCLYELHSRVYGKRALYRSDTTQEEESKEY